jgi:hypothetical protein
MNDHDLALHFSNPRLLGAIYYGLLSVVGTILIDAFLTLFGIKEIIPLYQAILVGMIVASATGALCGKSIIYCPRPFKMKTFLIGFTMVLVSLPFFVLGLVLCMAEAETPLFSIKNFQDLAYSYIVVLAYSYILFGFLLAIASGLASIYLRGWFVYDILHTDKRKSMRLPRYVARKEHEKEATAQASHKK